MQRRRQQSYLSRFLGLSLLVHLEIVVLAIVVHSIMPDGCNPGDPPLSQPIEVSLVDPVKPEELKKEEKKEEKKEAKAKGQVVDIPKPREEQRLDDPKRLAEYDSKVKRETKAPTSKFRPGKVVADRPIRRPQRKPTPQRRRQIEKQLDMAMRNAKPKLPKTSLPEEAKGDVKADKKQQPKQVEAKAQQKPSSGKKLSMKDLQLKPHEAASIAGTPVSDALKNVKSGQVTMLNARRWRFASFFNRVKRRVAQKWNPARAYRARDPHGNVYGFKDRLTVLRVKLTPEGKVDSLHLEKASGVGFLDDEALQAFRLAGPFPNPPKGLIDSDTQKISFRFGFLFELSRKPTFRIFRR